MSKKVIAIMLTIVMAVAVVATASACTGTKADTKVDDNVSEVVSPMVIEMQDVQGIALMSDDVTTNDDGSTSQTVTATVDAGLFADKTLDWSIAFKNPESEWWTSLSNAGYTIDDFVTLTVSNDTQSCVITMHTGFAEQIILTVKSVAFPSVRTIATIDYLGVPVLISNFLGVNMTVSEDSDSCTSFSSLNFSFGDCAGSIQNPTFVVTEIGFFCYVSNITDAYSVVKNNTDSNLSFYGYSYLSSKAVCFDVDDITKTGATSSDGHDMYRVDFPLYFKDKFVIDSTGAYDSETFCDYHDAFASLSSSVNYKVCVRGYVSYKGISREFSIDSFETVGVFFDLSVISSVNSISVSDLVF